MQENEEDLGMFENKLDNVKAQLSELFSDYLIIVGTDKNIWTHFSDKAWAEWIAHRFIVEQEMRAREQIRRDIERNG